MNRLGSKKIPEVIQVKPTCDFKVYVYFSDGAIKMYDVKPIIDRGGFFSQIASLDSFKKLCTVLNGTLAWDIGGNFDLKQCIDIDPCTIYESGQNGADPLKDGAA